MSFTSDLPFLLSETVFQFDIDKATLRERWMGVRVAPRWLPRWRLCGTRAPLPQRARAKRLLSARLLTAYLPQYT